MVKLTCEQCGKSYDAKPYMAGKSKQHFCGMACYAEWQKTHRTGVGRKRVIVQCFTCGKDIERQPNAVAEHNFCDRKCFGAWRKSDHWTGPNNPSWLGGHSESRGRNWSRQRRAARKRDNDTCQRCGLVAPGLPVHHARPFRLFDDYREANKLDNLITLCPTCHGITEQQFWVNHPELADLSPYPIPVPIQQCRSCGQNFTPGSGIAAVCDKCCTAKCAHCGNDFYSRKAVHRAIKYCSRACRNAAIKKPDLTRVCIGCGITFTPDRNSTKYCSQYCRMTKANPRRQFFAARKLAAQASSQSAADIAGH